MDVENNLSRSDKKQNQGGLFTNAADNDDVEEDENLFELQIKNLDTNEVFKIPLAPTDEIDQNYASKRKHE